MKGAFKGLTSSVGKFQYFLASSIAFVEFCLFTNTPLWLRGHGIAFVEFCLFIFWRSIPIGVEIKLSGQHFEQSWVPLFSWGWGFAHLVTADSLRSLVLK